MTLFLAHRAALWRAETGATGSHIPARLAAAYRDGVRRLVES